MRTLRLILWLRWRMYINTTTRGGRGRAIALTVLLAFLFSPFWLGGAIGAYGLARTGGAVAVPIVFGVAQLAWVWITLLASALGRLLDVDRLLRYPLRPAGVHGAAIVASLLEPACLVTLPALGAVTLALAQRDGALAAVRVALGAGLMVALIACVLQLLLAWLDDLLRREWMRYVAAFLFTGTMIGAQLLVGSTGRRIATRVNANLGDPHAAMTAIAGVFARIPTVAAPAAVAGAPAPWPGGAWTGALAALALAGLAFWAGVRATERAVRRPAVTGGRRRRSAAASRATARGAFALPIPGLSRPAALLVTREFVYFVRTPAVLYQIAVLPLFAIVLLGITRRGGSSPLLPFGVVGSGSFAGQNLTLFGHDGPGVKSLFLLPLSPRDIVLAKGLGYLAIVLVQGVLLVGGLTLFGTLRGWVPTVAAGYVALSFVATAAGTSFSILNPIRPPERGLGRRSATGPAGIAAWALSLIAIGVIGVLVWLARTYAPEPWRPAAGVAAATLCAAGGAAIWWISLDRNAVSLVAHRERMLDVLTRAAP